MFEIGFIARAGCEDNDAWGCRLALRTPLAGSKSREPVPQGIEIGREMPHGLAFEQFGYDAGHRGAVLEGIAGSRRGLGTVVDHPDMAIAAAGQVGAVHHEV